MRRFRFALAALALAACQAPWESAFEAYQQGDYAYAMPALQRLAEAGSAEAQYMLGHAHEWGRGAALDYGLARAWYQRAAAAGDALAPLALAEMAELGKGGLPDPAAACAWYALAAERAPQEERQAILARRGSLAAGAPGRCR